MALLMRARWAQGRKLRWIFRLFLVVSLVLLLFRSLEWDEYLGFDLGDNPPVRYAKSVLLPSLVNERELLTEPTIPGHGDPTLIYVLGGSQDSLKWRIPLAAELYHRESGSRVVFMNVREITEYSPAIGRNYTHDEWVTHEMVLSKVRASDIEYIAMPSGYFGTLGEARWVADLVRKRHYRRLILVTSAYHTRRVRLTFTHFLDGQEDLYVYGSDEKIRLHDLVAEYIKLLFYRYLLIPVSAGRP